MLVSVFLIILNVAQAEATIEGIGFFWGDNQLEYVNYKNVQIANLEFNINTPENLSAVVGDITEIYPLPSLMTQYNEIDFLEEHCFQNYVEETENNITTKSFTGYFCKMPLVKINPKNSTVNLKFNITYLNQTKTNITKQITFKLDDTKPTVTSLKTNYCEGDTCFIKSSGFNDITLQFSDSVGTFYQRKVFFKLGTDSIKQFLNCSSNQCIQKSHLTTCYSGDRLELGLVSSGGIPSSDDAGNPFEFYKTKVICDELPPEVKEVSHTYVIGNSLPSTTPLKQKDTIILIANITDDATSIKAFADFEELNNNNQTAEGTCEKTSTGATCTWNVIAENAGDINVFITAVDGVGRESVPERYRLFVDKFDGNVSIITPKYFNDATAISMAEQGYNRIAISLMLKSSNSGIPLYQKFKLSKKLSDDVQILAYNSIDETNCYVKLENGSKVNAGSMFSFKIEDKYLNWNEDNRLNLQFKWANTNMYQDQFEIYCNVSAYVRVNQNTVYVNPTEFVMKIPVKFRNSALGDLAPGEKLAQKIKEKEDSMEGMMEWIGYLDTIYASLSDMCSIYRSVAGISLTGAQIELVGADLAKIETTSGTAVQTTGAGIKDGLNSLIGSDTKVGQVATMACNWVQCDADDKYKANSKDTNFWVSSFSSDVDMRDWLSDDYAKNSGVGKFLDTELFNGIGRPDVKESIISSAATMCFPGIVYHINKYRQVQCHELLCYKQMSRYGLSLGACDEAESEYICQALVGEAFEFPFIRQAKNLIDNANALVQGIMPKVLKSVLDNYACDSYLKYVKAADKLHFYDYFGIIGCRLPHSVGQFTDAMYKVTDTSKNFQYPVQDDICSLAVCNKENVSECDGGSNSWFKEVHEIKLFDAVNLRYRVKPVTMTKGDVTKLFTEAKANDDAGKAARDQLISMGADRATLSSTDSHIYTPYCNTQLELLRKDPNPSTTKYEYKNGQLTYDLSPTNQFTAANNVINNLNRFDESKPSHYGTNTNLSNAMQSYLGGDANAATRLAGTDLETFNTWKRNYGEPIVANTRLRTTEANAMYERTNKLYLNLSSRCAGGEVKEGCTQIDLDTLEEVDSMMKQYGENPNPEKILTTTTNIANAQARAAERSKTINTIFEYTDQAVSFAMSYLYEQGIKSYLILSDFGHETVLGTISDWSNTYLSSDNWKTSICSPFLDFDRDEGEFQGTASQCLAGTCRPVLTFASEKLDINETDSLYTISYYLGNVRRPSGVASDETIKYKVYLKKPGVEWRLYKLAWRELKYGEFNNDEKALSQLLPVTNYEQICFEFEEPFPPLEQDAKTTYCRDIKDSTTGLGAYDTGSFNPEYVPDLTRSNTPSTNPDAINDY
ncbi:MAG: hypothetical protein PHU51_02525 [Candidatus Nanoarchaeia archaeon]|nr:hypothetical protein [Candidatus Nanoarchaeia archaeon]